jgi:urease accessory protein
MATTRRTTEANRLLLLLPILGAASPVFAHPGPNGDHAAGFAMGFAHPLGGLDHLLAMVVVGILGMKLGGKMRWALPALFLSAMAVGGALGMAGVSIPFVEAGIAASIVLLGLALCTAMRAPAWSYLSMTGIAAIFHGVAHGAELHGDGSRAGYAAGFLLATAILHLAGLGVGVGVQNISNLKIRVDMFHRMIGAPVALAGAWFLIAAH